MRRSPGGSVVRPIPVVKSGRLDKRFVWTPESVEILKRCYSRRPSWISKALAELPGFTKGQLIAKASALGLARSAEGHIPEGVLIDDVDRERALRHCWYIERHQPHYVASRIAGKIVRLHRFVMEAQPGEQVDHINGNRLDNRRANLRKVSGSINAHNRLQQSNSKSGFKNVFYCAPKRYIAQITVGGKRYHIGTFATPEEASRAVAAWRKSNIPGYDQRSSEVA